MALLSLFLWSTALISSSAATLYLEEFNADVIINSTGKWRTHNTASGTLAANPYGGTGVTTGTAAPTADASNRYAYVQNAPGAALTVDYFLFTSAVTDAAKFTTPIVPNQNSSLTASWIQNTGGDVTGMSYHFTVLVNNVWYATGNAYTGSGSRSLNLLSVDDWYAITFNPGVAMSLDTTGASVSFQELFGANQTISGLGFYINDLPGAPITDPPTSNHRTVRFDNLLIDGVAVPEPIQPLLLAMSVMMTLLHRRKPRASD